MTKNRLPIVLYSLLLVSLLISIFPSSIALADIVVNFPDPGLQQAIREAIGKPTGDIYQSDLEGLFSLEAGNRGITDLTGLEWCINLRYLSLNANQLGNITPLSGLINLLTLVLASNHISDISPLSSLTKLTLLTLNTNQISNISPLSSLTKLGSLDLHSNKIANISPLSSLNSLTWLYLGSNQIVDVQPLVSNMGLSQGDTVNLRDNPLSSESINVYIPQLQSRGVQVSYDIPVPTPTPTPTPPPATPVTGITRQVNGEILPGVSITLNGAGPVVSDQNGQYEIMATSTGSKNVLAHKDGFRNQTRNINIAGLGQGYAVTCNFQAQYGLIPNAPDGWYVSKCVNLWLFPRNPDIDLDSWTVAKVVNAWLYPVQ